MTMSSAVILRLGALRVHSHRTMMQCTALGVRRYNVNSLSNTHIISALKWDPATPSSHQPKGLYLFRIPMKGSGRSLSLNRYHCSKTFSIRIQRKQSDIVTSLNRFLNIRSLFSSLYRSTFNLVSSTSMPFDKL